MVRRRGSHVIREIRQRVQEGRVLFSFHAKKEMNQDELEDLDVLPVILHGYLVARQTHGARGTRYVFGGLARDGGGVEVVCRLVESEVRIITAYRL